MEYFAGADDNTIWKSGLTRQAYARALAAQTRTRTLEAQRQANFTAGQERHGSRFYEGGQPTTKVKWKQELDAAREAEIQRQYTAWKQAGEFSTPEGRNIAANLATYLGATMRNAQAFLDWFKSPETAQKYGTV